MTGRVYERRLLIATDVPVLPPREFSERV